MSATPESSLPTSDIILKKREKQSLILVSSATASWVLFQVYQFNLVTVISWVIIFIISSFFLLENLRRLLGKGPPNLSRSEIIERSTAEMAYFIHGWVEEVIRWMFKVGFERELFVFARIVALLLLLPLVGNYFNLRTLLFTVIYFFSNYKR